MLKLLLKLRETDWQVVDNDAGDYDEGDDKG